MKRTCTLIGICLLGLLMTSVALGRQNEPKRNPLTGIWDGVAHATEGDEGFTMTLDQDKDRVTGTISTANGGHLEIKSGSYKNNVLEIYCETSEAKYHVTGKLKEDQLSGDWSKDEDQKGTWEAKRSTSTAPGQ